MSPHPLSRSEPGAKHSPGPLPDLAMLLEQHAAAGFPRDLALDLVLNELVVRAADATHATAAALALLRGDQIVCRAATGQHAPDLGTPLDTHDGLSGACVRTRTPQLCIDAESDPRVDSTLSRRLGIRSMLMVPVFDPEAEAVDRKPLLTGVLEVFSPLPNTFSQQSQLLLADFADECARICRIAVQMETHPPADVIDIEEEAASSDDETGTGTPTDGDMAQKVAAQHEETSDSFATVEHEAERVPEPEVITAAAPDDKVAPARERAHQPYEVWTVVLGALVILAAAGFSFMIGSRIGWLRHPASLSSTPASGQDRGAAEPALGESPAPGRSQSSQSARGKDGTKSATAKSGVGARSGSSRGNPGPSTDDLVVYDKDKVIFRMGPSPAEGKATPANEGADKGSESMPAKARSVPGRIVWLAPAQAESRIVSRVEPQYPANALASHLSGDVTLEVHVAEDGSVSAVRTLSGDPLLAAAAADAVRNWRYQPFQANNQPSKFQTDVTLTFTLPN